MAVGSRTSQAILVNQRGNIAGEQLARLHPRGGGQLVTHAAPLRSAREATVLSLLLGVLSAVIEFRQATRKRT